mgnify:CR=1 FL=1
MKKNVWAIFVIILIMVTSCQQKPSALTDVQKETIKNEVQAQYDNFSKSINTMDINLQRQLYSESDFIVAIFNGMKIKAYETVIDSVYSWWSGREEQGIDKSDVEIYVISEDLAIVTSISDGHVTPKSGERFEVKNHVLNLLFNRETSGWKIIYYNESAL